MCHRTPSSARSTSLTDAATQGVVVLSGILPNRKDRLDLAMRKAQEGFFTERTHKLLWKMCERMYDTTGAVLSRHALGTFLHKQNPAVLMQMEVVYDRFAETEVDDADFITALDALKYLATEAATGEMLAVASDIMTKGVEVEKVLLEGHEDARNYIAQQITVIERDMQAQAAPEGDLKNERDSLLADYQRRKQLHQSGGLQGVRLGITNIDAKMNGMQRGELVLCVGYSSDGKSSMCVQAAWSAVVEQKKNVVFFTTETIREQINRKLLARHSKHPLFGLADGLNSNDLKRGTLTAHEEVKYQEIVNDFTTNSNYGHLYVAQVPRGATIGSLESKLKRVSQAMEVDLVIMDYLALLSPENRRQSDREQLAGIMREAKQVAVTFGDGRGVPFMSPWQVSRAAREQADKSGGQYTSAALAETSEATNSADSIISIIAPLDNTDRHCEVGAQVLKNRDGERADGLYLDVDYATSYFAAKSTLSGASGQFAPAATSDNLMDGLDI